jgi:formylglycine-generating enzyme required for sulfatase activity
VLRGGSGDYFTDDLRASVRYGNAPVNTDYFIGCRAARAP